MGGVWLQSLLSSYIWRISNGTFNRNEYFCKIRSPGPEQRLAVMKDIIAKWSHFSEQEVSALKGKADLVSQVVAKYGLDTSASPA